MNYPWQCPKCLVVYAPHVTSCHCCVAKQNQAIPPIGLPIKQPKPPEQACCPRCGRYGGCLCNAGVAS